MPPLFKARPRPYDEEVRMFLLLFATLTAGGRAFADPTPPSWNVDRRAGFAEHQREQKIFDRERLKGEVVFVEELEDWERQRKAAMADHKKQLKATSPQEGGREQREDLEVKKAYREEMEKNRQDYIAAKRKVMSGAKGQVYAQSEEVELGLTQWRPRYDLKNRVMYGARSKLKGGPGVSTSSGRGSGGFPPAPDFGDFPPPPPSGDVYVPPPIEEEYPPPPPPSEENFGDFPPPPPPPPPSPDFGDFPPPPSPYPPPDF